MAFQFEQHSCPTSLEVPPKAPKSDAFQMFTKIQQKCQNSVTCCPVYSHDELLLPHFTPYKVAVNYRNTFRDFILGWQALTPQTLKTLEKGL